MIFGESSYFTGPPITPELVGGAEMALGVRLPRAYVSLLGERNGGSPEDRCFQTAFANSWADDHIEITAIRGIGGERGIDAPIGGSAYLVKEWDYPDIGVVICAMPSGGHDAVMLDYSAGGPEGEPSIAYVDEDRLVRTIALTFGLFIDGLYTEQ